MKFALVLPCAGLVSVCFATPGAVDEYDCHRDYKTNEYHCHGSDNLAKQRHTLMGVSTRNDVWLYSDGPLNAFSGAAAEGEFGIDHVAIHGSYSYQLHVTGSSDYSLSGWDVGLKAGPSIARLGLHPYLDIGYFSQSFNLPFNQTLSFAGLQYGGGLVWNRPTLAMDIRLLNKTTTELAQTWTILGAPGLTANLTAQLGIYFRF